MNKIITLIVVFVLSVNFISAQETIEQDTTIHLVAQKAPRFPGCEQLDTTEVVKYECAQKNLLLFIYENVRYPLLARQENIEGTVVSSFVVEKDGTISSPEIIKEIGGGCGQEVLRIVGAMNQVKIRWKPGTIDGKPVRVRFNLPVKFKLEEAPDYVMVGLDSVYTNLDKETYYTDGQEALVKMFNESMEAPNGYQDSCYVGYMDVSLLVNPDKTVKVMNVNDYNNLGFDFQFEAIRLGNMTFNQWTPAERKGRKVSTVTDLRIPFIPQSKECASLVSQFEEAEAIAFKGSELYNTGETAEGIAQLSIAISMFPDNADFLYLRGQAYLSEQEIDLACDDFRRVRNILTTSPIHDIVPVLCK